MPRRSRRAPAGFVFHVLNRAVRRASLFKTTEDYTAFESVLAEAVQRTTMNVLAYCVMPNHWHLLLSPKNTGHLSCFMHWLTLTHTQRWHASHRTRGSGPLYQGRYKSFPVQDDWHFLMVCRYIERNPVRAQLVRQAQDWPWCSLARRCRLSDPRWLGAWPVPQPHQWLETVNQKDAGSELKAVRAAVRRGSPLGDGRWTKSTAEVLGLQTSLRPIGRPPKKTPDPF